MLAKEKVQKELKKVYEDGEVAAGQVYKGWDFDGWGQYYGWWFAPFNRTPIYLGRSVKEAQATIGQMADDREEMHREWMASQAHLEQYS